jgi:hypothetical protein
LRIRDGHDGVLNGYTEQHQRFLREQETTPIDPAIQRNDDMRSDQTSNANENLPTISEDRIIQGEILRCVDGYWSLRDGTAIAPDTSLLAIATNEALQHWRDQTVVNEIRKRPGEALPDADELNAQISCSEWEEGLDGQPRPPWQHVYIAYLINTDDASLYTFINSTVGARIAVERLQDKVRWMRTLRGGQVAPLVRLDSKLMKTRFGQKMRPEFTIVGGRKIGGGGLQSKPVRQIEQDKLEQIGRPVKPVTTEEELNDRIPVLS